MAITVEDVFKELKQIEQKMLTKEEFEEAMETLEILSNPETMASLRRAEKDIKTGKVKKISGVKDLLAE